MEYLGDMIALWQHVQHYPELAVAGPVCVRHRGKGTLLLAYMLLARGPFLIVPQMHTN